MTCVLVVFFVCIHPKESLYSAPCAYLQEQIQVLQGQFASRSLVNSKIPQGKFLFPPMELLILMLHS